MNAIPTANDDVLTVGEDDGPISGDNLLLNDIDADSNPDLAVVIVNGQAGVLGTPQTLASGAIVTVNVDGSWTYDPNGRFEFLTGEETATDVFSYAITDNVVSDDHQFSLLNGSNGFTVIGIDAEDQSGSAVSAAGDFNADGIDDFIIGASQADPNGVSRAGESYVVFGTTTPKSSLQLSDLDGTNGFVINGEDISDLSGNAVSGNGDINGDGIDDIVIAALNAGTFNEGTGKVYVVFGTTDEMASLDLSSLDGENGFQLIGVDVAGKAGRAVSIAGDMNGDGFDDLVIGDNDASFNGLTRSGEAYIVFGASSFDGTMRLSDLDGSNGVTLRSPGAYYATGRSASAAGDINGDGLADVIVGGVFNSGQFGTGEVSGSYVVFGSGSMPAEIALNSLTGQNGFSIRPRQDDNGIGYNASSVGDINGDGFDDVGVVATRSTSDARPDFGAVYVIFGKENFSASFNVSTINGANGVRISGENSRELMGASVSSAGDVNADGIDDLLVGSKNSDFEGEAYVIFGTTNFPGNFLTTNLDGTNGFSLSGITQAESAGTSVSAAGDVNGDGIDDLLVGAPGGTPEEDLLFAGYTYVIFGSPNIAEEISAATVKVTINGADEILVGTDNNDTLPGSEFDDTISGFGGDDIITGNAGDDFIDAGTGADFVDAGVGDDTVLGGAGNDTIIGSNGADDLTGNGGNDNISGGDGDDLLSGGGGRDILDGGDGHDTLIGGEAADNLSGGSGSDIIEGRRGSDFISGGAGNDIIIANGLADTVTGNGGNDLIRGGGGNDQLNGNNGEDQIIGGAGADMIDGGADDDILVGGGGNDNIAGGNGNDTISGGGGADVLSGGAGIDILTGNASNDTFIFAAGHEMATITDFRDNQDTLDLTSYGFTSVSEATALMSGAEGNVTFATGGDTLVISNITITQLEDDISI